jgi:hypothetical protein
VVRLLAIALLWASLLSGTPAWAVCNSFSAIQAQNNLADLCDPHQALLNLTQGSGTIPGGVGALNPSAHAFVTGNVAGVLQTAQPAFTDLAGAATAAQLPAPSASTIGGVESLVPATHLFMTGISTLGIPSAAQVGFGDLSGQASLSQIPTVPTTQISGLGTLATLGAAPAGTLTGSTLASGITASSLASLAGGAVGTAAYVSTGTSGGVVGLLNANKTDSGTNTFSGAMTLSGSGTALTVNANAAVGGTASLGNASGNYVQIAGSAGNPSISVKGTSGGSLLLVPNGTGAVNIQNGNGGNITQFLSSSSGTATDTLDIYAQTTTATPIRISTQNGYGINFQGMPIEQSRTYTVSGSEASFENQGLNLNFTVKGATTDTINNGPIGVITNRVTFGDGTTGGAFTCGFCGAPFNFRGVVAANSVMHLGGLVATLEQGGAPGTYPAWAADTVYSATTPSIVASGEYYYEADAPGGTSGTAGISTSCIPGASASLCWDGAGQTGVQWNPIDIVANQTYLLGVALGTNASYNAGGSLSGGPIGVVFGGNIIAHLYSGATFYAGVASFEVDTELDPGSSTDNALGGQFVHQGSVQGSYSDVALRIGSSGAQWLDGLAFSNAIDPNGTAMIFGGGAGIVGQGLGSLPFNVAGVLDMMDVQPSAICSGGNVGSGGAYGYGLLSCPANYSGGYFYLRTRAGPSGILGNGDIYTGTGALHAVAGGIALDTFQYVMTSTTLTTNGDGANWSSAAGSNYAHDGYGDEGTVSTSGGAVTSVTITVHGVQQSGQLPPAGNVTWYPGSAPASLTGTGEGRPPVPFTAPAANYTWVLGTSVGIGNTHATGIAIGNSGSTTTIAGVLKGAAGTFTADGTTATTMTALGPAGAHTTVQEWFTVTDAGGTVRYIPAY